MWRIASFNFIYLRSIASINVIRMYVIMKGYHLNKDSEHVAKIMTGIARKEGHCPCRILKDETTLCPCNEFVGQGICKCNLFVKIEN